MTDTTDSDQTFDPAALTDATEASVSAGRKKQLDQYEPINEQVTITVDLEGLTNEEKAIALEEAREVAWDECERGVQRRYEEYVREEAFGE